MIAALLDDLMQVPELSDEFRVVGDRRREALGSPCDDREGWQPHVVRVYQLPSFLLAAKGRWTSDRGTVQELIDAITQQVMPETWWNVGGSAAIGSFDVEDRKALVVRQTLAGHADLERLLRATSITRQDIVADWQDDNGWRVFLLPGRDAAAPCAVVTRSAEVELLLLSEYGGSATPSRTNRAAIANLFREFIAHNVQDRVAGSQVYVWGQQVSVLVNDVEDAHLARSVVESLLQLIHRVADEADVDAVADATLGERADRLVKIMLMDADVDRRQTAALLLRELCRKGQPLTPRSIQRLTDQTSLRQDRLFWQTVVDITKRTGPPAAGMIPVLTQALPILPPDQRPIVIDALGQLGPAAVPALCQIDPVDDQELSRIVANLCRAAVGDAASIVTIIETHAEASESRQRAIVDALPTIDPELHQTRQVVQDLVRKRGRASSLHWRRFRGLIEARIGDDPFAEFE
jgi:hypothetical protein